jgi:hypothetical protein
VEFSIAQLCLLSALAFDLVAALVGTAGALRPSWAEGVAVGLVGLALISGLARAGSDYFGSAANDVLRRLDLLDGIGRAIDPLTEADLLDDAPGLVQRWALKEASGSYFDSQLPPSAKRLVENVLQSAWFTKRLAADMAIAAGGLAWILVGVGTLLLIFVLVPFGRPAGNEGSAAWVAPIIVFLIAQSPFDALRRYRKLRGGAGTIQQQAENLLRGRPVNQLRALEIASDYHTVRASAPVIPTAWYDRRRDGLNRLWAATMQPGT